MCLYGGHLENPIWPPSAAVINGTVVYSLTLTTYLDTKISIVSHLDVQILIEIGLYMAAILIIPYVVIVKNFKTIIFNTAQRKRF